MRFLHFLVLAFASMLLVTMHLEPARADDGNREYQFARGLYARAQWDAAAKEFESFLQQYPQHPEVPNVEFYLGEALVQQRRYGDARPRFKRYLEVSPHGQHRKQAMFRLAECDYLGNRSTAQQQLETFSESFPEDRLNGLVLVYRGQIALRRGEPGEAEVLFRQSLDHFPDALSQDECRLGLARSLAALDRPDEAERYYLALAGKPQSPAAIEAKYRLASLRYAQQQYASALDTFTELDSIPESNLWAANAGLGKGWSLMKLDRHADAANVFARFTDHPAVAVQARYWLGLCRKSLEDWPGATDSFLAAAEKLAAERTTSPSRSSAADVTETAILFHAGDSQLAAGILVQARDYFHRAIAAGKPNDSWYDDALRASVQTSLRLEDYDRARSDAERFLRECPDSRVVPDLLRLLARIQLEQDDYQAAEQTLDRLGQTNANTSDSVEDAYLLALSFQGQGRHEAALQALQPVLADSTGELTANARLVEASLLVAMKRYQDALDVLSTCRATAKTDADRSQVLALTAVCHAQLGDTDEAFRLYQEAFGNAPEAGALRWDTAEQIAETALNANQYERAEALYRELIEGEVEAARKNRAMVGLAWVQHGRSDDQSAEATLTRLLETAGDEEASAEALFLRGQVLRALGQPERACQTFEQLLRDHATATYGKDALWDVAQLYENLGRCEDAAKTYQKILDLEPAHSRQVDALYSLAWLRHEEGNAEEAATLFGEIYTQHHDSPYWGHAALWLAQHESDVQRHDEAGTILDKLLSDDQSEPLRDRALYLSGQIAFAAGQWREARGAFEQLLDECPQSELSEKAAFAAAEAAFQEQDPESLPLFEQLLTADKDSTGPVHATVCMRLAQLYAEAGRWEDAMMIVESFPADHPDFAQQYELDYVHGRCLAARALFSEARQAYEKVVRSSTGENTETAAKAQLMIAETFFHQRRYADAYRAYMQVEILYAYPELQAAALLQAGKCQELLNNPQNAAELYRQVVKNHAGTRAAEQAALRVDREI